MRRTAITLVSLALAAAPLAANPAMAGEVVEPTAGKPDVLVRGLMSPLSLDVTPRGTVWFSQNFPGQLMRARPGKPARVMYQSSKGAEVGAVSVQDGVATFATTAPTGRTVLRRRTTKGRIIAVADLSRYERRQNPDGEMSYGITGLSEECASEWPEKQMGPVTYEGIVESHPYATLGQGRTTYVADAAANAILRVRRGQVSTVAVLPPQAFTLPADPSAMGLPACVGGKDYLFEAVPTDVEVHDGKLYVTTLPGGPESPELGKRAKVYEIDPRTGVTTERATGLLSATGLAVARNGDLYVAELFGNRIARVPSGSTAPTKWARTSMPGDVELKNGRVWASRKVLTGLSGQPGDAPKGQVVRFPR